MRELAEDDEEDDEAWDPAIRLVRVHDFVAKEGNEEGASSNDDDTRVSWHITIDGMDQLRADYDIDSGPAKAGKAVEDGDDFDAVVSEEKS